MKIGMKLGLGFGLVILLLIVVAATGIFELSSVNNNYKNGVVGALHVEIYSGELGSAILQVRRNEKDFAARQDEKYYKEIIDWLDEAERINQVLGTYFASIEDRKIIENDTAIDKNLLLYRQAFEKYYTASVERGLTENGGIQKAFRDNIQTLEAKLNGGELELLLLTIRKNEKDYMLRADQKYIAAVHQYADQLTARSGANSDMQSLIINYRRGFDQLVAKDREIAGHLTVMRTSADEVLVLADENTKLAGAEADQQSALTDNSVKTATMLVWMLSLFCTLVAVTFAFFFARSITGPMAKTVAMIEELANGHLNIRLNMVRKDEIGQMADSMDRFADSLEEEVVAPLQKLAAGDLTFQVNPRDGQDVLRGALKKLSEDLGALIMQIQTAGEQIASGSSQVSDGSQSLSQGATESAASLEQITASMTEMGSQTRQSAENATQANTLSATARDAAEGGNAQMQQMVQAMGEINDASQNISKIIKTIDEIAFQTNLLALNAAVEAARAGQHGKGFAVVAEEVRNLAARSARAARETAELIEGSVKKAENGARIADRTAGALGEIVTGISKVSDLVAEIAAASNEQAQGIAQVSQGLSQIDQVTQQNTASAEQSAAAAEELSGQAAQLQEMLSRFKLNNSHATLRIGGSPKMIAAAPVLRKAQSAPKYAALRPEAVIALDDSEFGRY